MENFLQSAQDKFTHGIFPDLSHELDLLESLLIEAGPERIKLATWVFKENKMGFVGTRTTAGLILYAEVPQEFWGIVRELIKSEDDFDRDAAFYSLCEVNDSQKYDLIRPLLFDNYLRFEAIDFFIENEMCLAEIEKILTQIIASNDPKITPVAIKRLSIINAKKK